MTVTKQQQLEWLAKHVDEWVNDIPEAYLMSVDEVGFVVGLATIISPVEMIYGRHHVITRQEWQQERDKMQKQQDNSWYERGEFPPVGCECEVREVNGWIRTFIVGFDGDGYCVYTTPWSGDAGYYNGDNCPERFRPLSTEREKAIDAACEAIGCVVGGRLITGLLYDAGMLK